MKTLFIQQARLWLAAGLVSLASVAAAQETLTFSWPRNVGPLDPHAYGANQMFAQDMVYEGLVRYRADGSVEPWLAELWEVSEDRRSYTFYLRPGVTFSNGERFDAAAVKKNFDAILARRDQHGWLDLINQIKAVETPDAMTVRLMLETAYYPLLQELSLARPVRFLAPSQITESGASSGGTFEPSGTGPWQLVETALGEHDVFQRNDRYWGPLPAYERVVVKVISDPNTRAIALETGEIDLVYGTEGQIAPDTFERFRAMGRYQTALSDPLMTRVLALNTGLAPTSDAAVRRAINHAVNKDLLVSAILHDTHLPADTLFAPTVPYADLGLPAYGYDPAEAKAILEAAGWVREGSGDRQKDGQPLRIELAFVGSDALMKAMAEIIQADLRTIGIDVVLLGEEEGSFTSRQKSGAFGMIFNDTWGAPYDPHAFAGSMRAPAHADYQAQLGLGQKAQLDSDITEVLLTTDEERRRDLYRGILTTLHEEAVYLPLTYQRAILVARAGIGGVGFGATPSHIPFEALTPPGE